MIPGGFSRLKAGQHITADLRLPGGQQHHLTVLGHGPPGNSTTPPASTRTVIDDLLAEHPADEAVTILNQRGLTGGWGNRSPPLCRAHKVPSLRQRLRGAGMLTLEEIADQLDATPETIHDWPPRAHHPPSDASTAAAPASLTRLSPRPKRPRPARPQPGNVAPHCLAHQHHQHNQPNLARRCNV